MKPPLPVPLAAARIAASANAGDHITLPLVVKANNTTAWTLTFTLWAINASRDGSTGSPIGTGTITSNTFSSPDSSIQIDVAASVTNGRSGQTLWLKLQRTDTGAERTLIDGPLCLK